MSLRRVPLPIFVFAAVAIVAALFLAAGPSRAEILDVRPSVPVADTAEAAHIRDLIHQLALMDHGDFGVTSYAMEGWGMAFAPDAAPDSQSPFRRPDTRREQFPAFVELVRLGPRSLPYLLQAMDDQTPTRLPIWHGLVSIMSTTAPQGNRANARETKILAEWAKTHRRAVDAAVKAGHLVYSNQMTLRNPDFVTVGDVCITAIGQITGRDYQHLRFWGDGRDSLVIMDYDAITPATLRAIWSDCGTPDTVSRQLLVSLLLDYRSRAGKPDRTSDPEAATFSDDWQISASQRLLFYYPKQTAPMIAARLNALLVGSTGPNESSLQAKRQRDANQVDPVEFIEAVAECPDAAIRKPIRSIFLRSDDVHVWLACLPALDPVRDWPMIESRFGSLVRKNAWFSGFTGITDVLIDLRSFGGERARPLFRALQKTARTVDDCDTVICALMVSEGSWDREFVAPFLTDRRMTLWTQPIASKRTMPEKRMRLCDIAANVICWHRGQTVFPPPGAEKDLDLFERHLAETMAAGKN